MGLTTITQLGCAPPAPASGVDKTASPADPSAPVESAETAFGALEQRLRANELNVQFTVVARGAVAANLTGHLRINNEVELVARGDFAGQPQDLRLWTEGDHLHAEAAGVSTFTGSRPAKLEPALVLGFTRMGMLHNLAMLTGGAPPDHSEQGVPGWAEGQEFRFVDRDGRAGIAFALRVDDQPSGQVTLWLDEDGRPVFREQVVEFPEGQMLVEETYESSALTSVPSGP